MKIKICHISTVHSAFDTRIFHKECKSLYKSGFEVYLIVQHINDEIVDGIKIKALPFPKNRKERILLLNRLAYKKALDVNAEIYHFHDPELIPLGLKLKKLGKKVIYDIHEDVPRDILTKPYINKYAKPIISKLFEMFENFSSKKFDYLITATPHIRDRFKRINPNTIDVNNYPILEEFFKPVEWRNRKNHICYIGGITRIRGIVELMKALEYVDTVLHLAGNFENEKLKKEVMSMKSWKKVKYYGFVDRNCIKNILAKVKIGIINFLPLPNHTEALPNKMFEYMSAGIAIVASNFPLWKEIIEKNNCGICVNPLNPYDIAKVISELLNDDSLSRKMGQNGRRLVETRYNWEKESEKLINVYRKLLNT